MTSTIPRSRSGNPPSGFPPLDPRLRRGTALKASASPPLIREKPVKPKTAAPAPHERPTILTRAEVAPCTCPEPCERDHEND